MPSWSKIESCQRHQEKPNQRSTTWWRQRGWRRLDQNKTYSIVILYVSITYVCKMMKYIFDLSNVKKSTLDCEFKSLRFELCSCCLEYHCEYCYWLVGAYECCWRLVKWIFICLDSINNKNVSFHCLISVGSWLMNVDFNIPTINNLFHSGYLP